MIKEQDKWLAEKMLFESMKVAEELQTADLLQQLEKMIPKNLKIKEHAVDPSEQVQKTLEKLGKFKPWEHDGDFEESSVYGPFQYGQATYVGGFKDGVRNGFGTLVRMRLEFSDDFGDGRLMDFRGILGK